MRLAVKILHFWNVLKFRKIILVGNHIHNRNETQNKNSQTILWSAWGAPLVNSTLCLILGKDTQEVLISHNIIFLLVINIMENFVGNPQV